MTQQPPKDLEPCPFCGNAGKASNMQFAEGKTPWPTELWWVGCEQCGIHFMGGSNVEIAKDRWNTRAAQSSLDVREVLEREYKVAEGEYCMNRHSYHEGKMDALDFALKALSSSGENTKEEQ